MAEGSKRTRDTLKDLLLNTLLSDKESGRSNRSKLDLGSAKDLLNATLSWAGKSKDDFIQMVGREIGQALAQILEPSIKEIVKDKKVHITFEIRPKEKTKAKSSRARK